MEVVVLGVRILGLLDSGADCTILGQGCEQLVDALKLKTTKMSSVVLTADGTHHVVAQSVNIPFVCNNQTHALHTLLLPTLKKKLILGIDFFRAFNIKLKIVESVTTHHKLIGITGSNLSRNQLIMLDEIIQLFPAAKDGDLGQTHILEHRIDTGDSPPFKQRYYPISPYIQKEADVEYDRMLRLGVIEPSESAWNSPMVAVRKSNGKIRLCLDSRKLNSVTKKDSYPMPHMNRILGSIRATKFLSKIDLRDAYWQVPLEKSSKEKTAFTIPNRGLFQFRVMPFGLHNSGQTQCRLMDTVLGFDLEPYVFAYMDDIIVATSCFEDHIYHLKEVCSRLKKAGLKVNLDKSEFCTPSIKYLGYVLNEKGLNPDTSKVDCVLEFPTPKSTKETKRLLGMANWYRRFIGDFSTMVAPITDLTKKGVGKFKWTDDARIALEQLKIALTTTPVLSMPDFNKPFSIHCDASNVGVGAVLLQGEGNDEQVIAFMSKKLLATEMKYSATERECLAVLMAIEHFRPYIDGVQFTVITDHSSLTWLMGLKEPVGRLGRWILKLQQYNFKLIHRKGKFNIVPDTLSRAFVESLDVQTDDFTLDPDYNELRRNITNNPEKYPDLKVTGNIIFKHDEKNSPKDFSEFKWRLYVPSHLKNKVLRENHDDPLASHFGYYKTVRRIRSNYFWPKMAKEIRMYTSNCDVCKASKDPTYAVRHEMGQAKVLTEPWRVQACDFLGPLPRSKNGHTFLFVIMDCFTKFIVLIPLRRAETNITIKSLEEQVFLKFGVPEILISDNGPQFIAKRFREFLTGYNISHWKNAVYHAQHNPAERPNKVIAAAIRSYIGDDHREWDIHIQKIASAINTSAHQSSKFSPYYMNFGRTMVTTGSQYKMSDLEKSLNDNSDSTSSQPDARDVADKLNDIRLEVSENLREAYDKYSKYYNLRSRTISFSEGETIWRKNFALSDASRHFTAKLSPKYLKCRVRKKIGNCSYMLEDLNGKEIGVYNVKDLKRDSVAK